MQKGLFEAFLSLVFGIGADIDISLCCPSCAPYCNLMPWPKLLGDFGSPLEGD